MTHTEILSVFGASIVSLKINTESLNQKRLREIAETQQEVIKLLEEPKFYYQACKDVNSDVAHCEDTNADFFGVYKRINGQSFWITDVDTKEEAVDLVNLLNK